MSEIIDGSLLKILEYHGLYKPHSCDNVPGIVYDLNNLLKARIKAALAEKKEELELHLDENTRCPFYLNELAEKENRVKAYAGTNQSLLREQLRLHDIIAEKGRELRVAKEEIESCITRLAEKDKQIEELEERPSIMIYEDLKAKLKSAEDVVENAIVLLNAAACPECDGSGSNTEGDEYDNPIQVQCRWCTEKAALSAYDKEIKANA